MEKDEKASRDLTKLELPSPRRVPATKKRSALGLLRAATFIVRRRSGAKKALAHAEAPESGPDGKWKNLVSGIRPLHLHQLEPSAPALFTQHESFHDVLLPPPSPSSSADGMSRYASAEDLRSLDKSEEDDEEAGDGDHAIDLKAEEFIARFYEQMKLQSIIEQDAY